MFFGGFHFVGQGVPLGNAVVAAMTARRVDPNSFVAMGTIAELNHGIKN
jgi:hypothetical protein